MVKLNHSANGMGNSIIHKLQKALQWAGLSRFLNSRDTWTSLTYK